MIFLQVSSVFILLTLWSGVQAEQFMGEYVSTVKSPFSSQEQLQPETDLWTAAGLVEDLSLGAAPVALLKVAYGTTSVTINGTLTPEETAEVPAVALVGAINCMPPFSLVMLDPDAPSREHPTLRSWLHWMVVNAESTRRLDKGEVAMPYNGPTPPEGSGPHRYVFLAFCQGGKRVGVMKFQSRRRKKFHLKNFRKKIGNVVPFGGTFFYAENVGMMKSPPRQLRQQELKI
ncbi:protein D1-like [Dermacentor andersoni]|uniref:protein D1-like n=1 Tax=Dermacentor andersoni TaxID=34620 RepID=UPI002155D638|nr:protein D1-like [Dermacentor andersoni]